MKREDRQIKYRPELSKKLQDALDFANKFYKINFKKCYYLILSSYYKEKDKKLSELLFKASECFEDSLFGEENFYEYYEKTLRKDFGIEILSTARASYVIFNIYEDCFDKFLGKIDFDDLTKMEKFMVESFFRKLKAPMNNPNIKIPEGQVKCYYDRDISSNYLRDLNFSLEYLNKECKNTIEIFSIPD